ncbi:MAG: radical SAM protein, partial [Bacteroidota bacterium]
MNFTGKKAAFHTLGCKLNFSETSTIAKTMIEHGFEKVNLNENADVYVINTCSVTDNADKECRQIVRNILKKSPSAFIAVIGCYAQLKPDEIAGIEGVDVVLGAKEKFRLLTYLNSLEKNESTEIHNCSVDDVNFFSSSYSSGDRTRSFLKVQDGCDYSCTFCTIPLARGGSRSDSIDNVLRNVEKIADSGIKEVVLTGVNLGDFGYGEIINSESRKTKQTNFLELVQELDKINRIERFRISSIEPNLLSDEIIEFVASSKRFAPHFHIP